MKSRNAGGKQSGRRLMPNIFSALVVALNSIHVSGEEDMKKMLGVIDTLKRMEQAAQEKEETENG